MMDEISHNLSEGSMEASSAAASSPGHTSSEDLRKRRSTRIVQAVPLAVTGVDAIGRPFTEHTSSLIINCHGCRYQSKHYVLKNMWVKLEIPHPESGHAPRVVRGRVAWIQRPRTVRQLFQVALELETPGNAWGIAFPPEDWFAFPDVEQQTQQLGIPVEGQANEMEHEMGSSSEPETTLLHVNDNLRSFPSPTSTTDASLQLARQLARLVADAKQQIQAAAREAAGQAVAMEHRASFEQWDQKFAAARVEVGNEASRLIEKIQQETEKHAQAASAAAAEALRKELPRTMAPQLENMMHELTAQLSQEGAAQRDKHVEHFTSTEESLRTLLKEAEESVARLKAQAEEAELRLRAQAEISGQAQAEAERVREETRANLAMQAEETESHIAERADAAARTMDEAARVREEALMRMKAQAAQTETQIAEAGTRAVEEAARVREQALTLQWQALRSAGEEIQREVMATLSSAHMEWESHVAKEMEAAQARWQSTIETSLPGAQDRAVAEIEERGRELFSRLREEAATHGTALKEQAAGAAGEMERRITTLRESLQEALERLEFTLAKANESSTTLDHFSSRLGVLHEQALVGFHTQLDDVLSLHRNEQHRRSESVFEEMDARVKTAFEEASQQAARISKSALQHCGAAPGAYGRVAASHGGRALAAGRGAFDATGPHTHGGG